MKNVTLFLLMIFFITTSFYIKSCNVSEDEEDCDYSDCDTQQPTEGKLTIEVTINDENPKVPITIYNGKIESNVVIKQDTLTKSKIDYRMPVNSFYTVAAYYKSGNDTILAINGDEIKAKSKKECDSTCWTVEDARVKLYLKF